jgi:hypothetical protein
MLGGDGIGPNWLTRWGFDCKVDIERSVRRSDLRAGSRSSVVDSILVMCVLCWSFSELKLFLSLNIG